MQRELTTQPRRCISVSSLSSTSHNEVCPSCGNFTDDRGLNEITGWCYECSPLVTTSPPKFYIRHSDPGPFCVVCGGRIERAKRNAIFCRQHKECRRMSRRYVYLYTERNMTKVAALATILNELNGGE